MRPAGFQRCRLAVSGREEKLRCEVCSLSGAPSGIGSPLPSLASPALGEGSPGLVIVCTVRPSANTSEGPSPGRGRRQLSLAEPASACLDQLQRRTSERGAAASPPDCPVHALRRGTQSRGSYARFWAVAESPRPRDIGNVSWV